MPEGRRASSRDRDGESDGAETHRSGTYTDASRDTSGDTSRDREEAERRHRQESARRDMQASSRVESFHRSRIDAVGYEQAERVKQEAWKALCKVLKTDPESIKLVKRAGRKMGCIKFVFAMVLAGCELDLYGFGMAFLDYWALDELFIRILLVTGPVSYLLACVMYMFYADEVERRREAQRRKEEKKSNPATGLRYLPQSQQPSADSPRRQQALQSIQPSKEAVKMRLYHFIPLFRYYLILKEKETEDIESLFRVNSLSSFSLGIAQLCGIVFSGLATNWEMSIFAYINIFSQVINWSITILYFMTPVATQMGNTMKIDALAANSENRLRRLVEEYQAAVRRRSEVALQEFEGNIDREILTLANITLDLSPFTVEDKITALTFLKQRQIRVYAQI